MPEASQVGVIDRATYYEKGLLRSERRISISDSIHLDQELMRKKKGEGYGMKSLKTFLIGGCFSPDSIYAMVDFIKEVNPDEKITLLVADINQEAFDLIREAPIYVPGNITLKMFRGDLTELALESGSVDYVRMDYTQNFIPLAKQIPLLKELNRVTSDSGIVASVIDMIPLAQNNLEKVKRHFSRKKGCIIDAHDSDISGYTSLLPSEEFMKSATKSADFRVSYIEARYPESSYYRGKVKLAVFEKRQRGSHLILAKK